MAVSLLQILTRVPMTRKEEFTGLRRAIILIVMVYYSEIIQIKITRGINTTWSKIQEEAHIRFQGSPSSGIAQGLILPAGDNTQVAKPGNSPKPWWTGFFYWGSVM